MLCYVMCYVIYHMQGDAKAAEKFQEVGKAYDTLRDSQKRAIYDQVGKLPSP